MRLIRVNAHIFKGGKGWFETTVAVNLDNIRYMYKITGDMATTTHGEYTVRVGFDLGDSIYITPEDADRIFMLVTPEDEDIANVRLPDITSATFISERG